MPMPTNPLWRSCQDCGANRLHPCRDRQGRLKKDFCESRSFPVREEVRIERNRPPRMGGPRWR